MQTRRKTENGQTDTHTDGRAGCQTDGWTERRIGDRQLMQARRKTENGQTDRQIDRKAWFGICRVGRLEGRQKTDREMGVQAVRQTDRQMDKKAGLETT